MRDDVLGKRGTMVRGLFKLLAVFAIFFQLTGASLSAPVVYTAKQMQSLNSAVGSLFPAQLFKDASAQVNRMCLAVALYHEARGEPLDGQMAVGITIMNRVESRAYPSTICGVVFENAHRLNKCQFSFACDNLNDFPANSAKLSELLDVSDVVLGATGTASADKKIAANELGLLAGDYMFATHYHRHDVNPSWSKKLTQLARIGDHVFFRSERVVRRIPENVRDERLAVVLQNSAFIQNARFAAF